MATKEEKAEMLRNAKEKAIELEKNNKLNQHIVEKLMGASSVLSDMPEKSNVLIRDNKDSSITLPAGAALVKLSIQGCSKCTVTLEACTISTGTIELWDCRDVELKLATTIGTLQLDMNRNLTVEYAKKEHLGQIVQAGCMGFALKVLEDGTDLQMGLAELRAAHPDKVINDTTDQYITRYIEGKLLTEEILRLHNDYPTTAREKAQFDSQTDKKAEALEDMVRGMVSGESKLSEEEKAELKRRAEETKATEHAMDTSDEARAEFKKNTGNDCFKAGDYAQAAFHYTEALLLTPNNPALYSNRSACLLKVGQTEKAFEDASKCIELDSKFVKGHFRRAMAAMNLQRWEEAGISFAKTLELDPQNKEARASIQLAQAKAHQARMARSS
mmetsp:Transcript_21407/g.50327  ORF Transcript_21407/g.50327 Transcript_21407/m.50327 type:complete len:387 (+) Transcript_21407:39-1199(+)